MKKMILALLLLASLGFADNCTGAVQFKPGMTQTNTQIQTTALISVFNGSSNSSCFLNYTGYLETVNGTVQQIATSTDVNASNFSFLNIPIYRDVNGAQLPYLHYVVINFVNGSAQTETRQYYFTQGTSFGLVDDDALTIGTIIAFALLALVFFYLHANSESNGWAYAWLFFGCLMALVDLLAITYFSQQGGATAIANTSIALVVVFVALFAFAMLLFIWTTAFMLFVSARDYFKKLLRR